LNKLAEDAKPHLFSFAARRPWLVLKLFSTSD